MHGDRIVDIISHFAGYFELLDDTARLRIDYDDFLSQRLSEDYLPQPRPETEVGYDLDDFQTSGVKLNVGFGPPGLFGIPVPGIPELLPPNIHQARLNFDDIAAQRPFIGPAISPGPGPNISITYGAGGDQVALNVVQINRMLDDDMSGPNYSAAALQTYDTTAKARELVQEANGYLPDGLTPDHFGYNGALDYTAARDADSKENGEPGASEFMPGFYLNGVLQPEGSEVPVRPDSEDEGALEIGDPGAAGGPPSVEGAWAPNGSSQSVISGGNTAFNGAVIIDKGLALGTMVVAGDSYSTNAIVQINAYVDDDHVGVGAGFGGAIEMGGTLAHNAARFLKNEIEAANPANGIVFSGPTWKVDIFDGDFYDVKVLNQLNWLRDNDVSAQHNAFHHSQLIMGANEQGNFVTFLPNLDSYDLVIVLGDYHAFNLIYQKNILLDPDVVKQYNANDPYGAGEGDGPAISTGNNWLMNNALIENFGPNETLPMGQSWFDLISALNSRDSEIDISYGMGLPNFNDPTFNVLMITGHVWDINMITQTNIIEDADVAIQYVPIIGPDGSPVWQTVATGGNELANAAAIVKVGPVANQYVGGDFYEDEILIQAEIVASDDDDITYGDPDELASELVAFTTPTEGGGGEDEAGGIAAAQDPNGDIMGNMLT